MPSSETAMLTSLFLFTWLPTSATRAFCPQSGGPDGGGEGGGGDGGDGGDGGGNGGGPQTRSASAVQSDTM